MVIVHTNDRVWVASDTRRYMHAAKHPCGLFYCDNANEMQVYGLDAPGTRQDLVCTQLARQMLSEGLH